MWADMWSCQLKRKKNPSHQLNSCMLSTIAGLIETVLEHKARAQDSCKEKRKRGGYKPHKLFSPVIYGIQAPLQQYSNRQTSFIELPSQSQTHPNQATSALPHLPVLPEGFRPAPTPSSKGTLRVFFFLTQSLALPLPIPPVSLWHTDCTFPEQGQTSCLFLPW